ncbi:MULTISPECIES: NlpC/P60 family protein [unclassified Beijerinckia]|uniref:NlpC/P60 family protein n=1 Tax=unclassified Beijerinckia TaxID=2638183 RepID=UPI00089AA142|nr:MULTISPECIES: NlpC/P60 family protein [unclassified Beijerinckia]MDH7796437.1 cell wall-associated NlpC family hydrolase [Beijerinckia sp. GAS462]SEC45047.1 NlpC/P60 family protein [Beijerinckia sp. 28-YEA-48]
MIQYQHLLGRTFKLGSTDCYGLVREFYKDNFGIQLRNYARPMDFWDHNLNLYVENFTNEGFRPLSPAQEHPAQWKPGDAVLMAIRSPIANHAAVILPSGNILHHMLGKLSVEEPFRPAYRNAMVAILRHKDVVLEEEHHTMDVMELLPDGIREKIARDFPRGVIGTQRADRSRTE